MKRLLLVLSTAALLAFGGTGQGGPATPFKSQPIEVPPLASRVFNVEWEGEQRACAIVLGDGSTYMGLYVYDIHGNCIAWDDEGMPQTCDDVAVEWYPTQKGVFVVEARNNGMQSNNCKVVLR